jgi:hypothetical protein
MRGASWALVCGVVVLAFAPSFAYLLTGVVLFPHQLNHLMNGEMAAWSSVAYYPACACLMIGIVRLLSRVRNQKQSRLDGWTGLSLLFGLGAVLLGPAGIFFDVSYRGIGMSEWLLFVILPVACTFHLIYLVLRYRGPASISIHPTE